MKISPSRVGPKQQATLFYHGGGNDPVEMLTSVSWLMFMGQYSRVARLFIMSRVNAMQSILGLLPKLDDPDPDIRFMQLNDLAAILVTTGSESLRSDTHTSAKVIDRIIKALTDGNGEVQNQALKWLVTIPVHFQIN